MYQMLNFNNAQAALLQCKTNETEAYLKQILSASPFFGNFGYIFYKLITFRPVPAKTNLSRLSSQNIIKNQKSRSSQLRKLTAQRMNQLYR